SSIDHLGGDYVGIEDERAIVLDPNDHRLRSVAASFQTDGLVRCFYFAGVQSDRTITGVDSSTGLWIRNRRGGYSTCVFPREPVEARLQGSLRVRELRFTETLST